MSDDVLTVPTHFADISEMAAGLVDRVDEERLILYGPTPYEEGGPVQFQILLADGSAGLEGSGRVAASIDGGEDRAPETRYDIVIDSLQLAGHAEVVFERLLLARQSAMDGEQATGEVDVSEVEQVEQDAALSEPPPADEPTTVAAADYAEHAEATAEPEAPADEAAPQAAAPDFDFGEGDEATAVAPEGYQEGYEASPSQPPATSPEPEAEPAAEPEMPAEQADVAPAAAEMPEMGEMGEPEPEQPAVGDFGDEVATGEETGFGDEQEATIASSPEEIADAAQEAAADTGFEEPMQADEATSQVDLGDMEDLGAAEASPEDVVGVPDEEAGEPEEHEEVQPVARTVSIPPVREGPQPPQPPPGFQLGGDGVGLTRPSQAVGWEPVASPRPEPQPSTGWFAYDSGPLPLPERPPRPDLDPTMRVSPAPRPEGGAAAAGGEAMAAAPAAEPAAEAPPMGAEELDAALDVEPAEQPDAGAFEDFDAEVQPAEQPDAGGFEDFDAEAQPAEQPDAGEETAEAQTPEAAAAEEEPEDLTDAMDIEMASEPPTAEPDPEDPDRQ